MSENQFYHDHTGFNPLFIGDDGDDHRNPSLYSSNLPHPEFDPSSPFVNYNVVSSSGFPTLLWSSSTRSEVVGPPSSDHHVQECSRKSSGSVGQPPASSSSSEAAGGGGGGEEDSSKSRKNLEGVECEDGEDKNKGKKKEEKKQREPRFAFITKSEIDNLEDGYRWRKYGQKAVKNSPFPRQKEMASIPRCFGAFYVVLLAIFFTVGNGAKPLPARFFNVLDYGAVPDGRTDNVQAFLRAWDDACQFNGRSRVWIPSGVYKLGSVEFSGPCKAYQLAFLIKGTLKSPTERSEFNTDTWIAFNYMNNLVVKGGGYLDGQGHRAWPYNDCSTNSQCGPLPATLTFNFVNNSRVTHLKSINSKNTHFHIFACNGLRFNKVRLMAPEDSPNTDGIKIGSSNDIHITNSVIQTGDDCVAMVAGSRNIRISQVTCGPGHGISIGSIGKNVGDLISGIHVINCTFIGSDNGVRIKTWAPSMSSLVSDVFFGYIHMIDVRNPIIIDQNYCPGGCGNYGSVHSKVQINDVTFNNIWGTSTSKVALALQCSPLVPCKDVNLVDINLNYFLPREGPALSSCRNVIGKSKGILSPPGCL
nr:exopolygalacturonase-like [Ipomoea batatas]